MMKADKTHSRSVFRSALKQIRETTQKGRPVCEVQNSNEENWKNSEDKMDRHIDMVP